MLVYLLFLSGITLSSSLLLDDDLYQYTLPFNIYYFVVQPRLDDNLSQHTLLFNIYYFAVQPRLDERSK